MRDTISHDDYLREDGGFYETEGGALDVAIKEVFKRVNDAQILGQDPIALQKIEYAKEIMTIRLTGKGSFEQQTQKILRICVKLTIEEMISKPMSIKTRNKIPAISGFNFIYTHSYSFSVPKEGVFTVTPEISKK